MKTEAELYLKASCLEEISSSPDRYRSMVGTASDWPFSHFVFLISTE